MKIKLFLLSAISLASVACSNQVTGVEEEYQTAVESYKSTETIMVLDSTKKDSDRGGKPENGRPSVFGDLLAKLNLTPEQKPKVEMLLVKHKACTEECVKVLKNLEREILKDAKVKEDAIKNKLKSGEITKEAALKELRQLKEKTKEALKSIPEKSKVRECLASCDSTFLAQLKELLSPAQLEILAKWQESKRKRR